ncbi:MAG TPA: RNA polymerase-binding protein DksA [Desulfobacterales bacterium]
MDPESDDGYRPSEAEPYMNPRQLAYFRRKLTAWRDDLTAASEETLSKLREGGKGCPDPMDRASQETDTIFELRTRDRYRKLLHKIAAALARIDDGTYGYCEETGEPIGIKRLEARPVTTLCIEAMERHERAERQARSQR